MLRKLKYFVLKNKFPYNSETTISYLILSKLKLFTYINYRINMNVQFHFNSTYFLKVF